MLPEKTSLSGMVDLRDLCRILRRQKHLILGIVLAGIAITLATLAILPALYTSTAKLIIDPRETKLVNIDQILSALPANAETIQSEIEVLRARDLASRVIDKLSLANNEGFTPKFATPSKEAALDIFLKHLEVRAMGRSRVIAVSYTDQNPQLAASIVNTLTALYLDDQAALRTSANHEATQWLDEKRAQLQTEAEQAEEAVSIFKSRHKLSTKHDREKAANTPASANDLARLTTLEREASVSRDLYNSFLERYKQASRQDGWEQADARLISHGAVPSSPSFPDTKLTLLCALFGCLGLGFLAALVAERLDTGFRSSDQIEQMLGRPAIALIPSIETLAEIKATKTATPPSRIEDEADLRPHGAFAESIRNLRLSVLLSNVDNPPKIIQITSSLPEEGKTSLAIALARSAAQSGSKVLLIDGDLRRPRVHQALGIENKQGLVDLLTGTAKPEKIIQHKPATKTETTQNHIETTISILPAGHATANAADLMRSKTMTTLLASLAKSYDLIIIDTPPVLPVADAKALCPAVDSIVFIIKWASTPRPSVFNALRQLHSIRPDAIAGIVLNRVDVTRHAQYGYSDSGLYSRKYQHYYGK